MSLKVPGDKVVEYIRNTLQPISYEVLLSKFCSSKEPAETRNVVKHQLQKILLSNVKSGSLLHYRNHFYCSSLSQDVEDMAGFNLEDDDFPSDQSDNISISSCESGHQPRSVKNVQKTEQVDSTSALLISGSELTEIKSQQSVHSCESQDPVEEPVVEEQK